MHADGGITPAGRALVHIPLEPQLARAVLASLALHCAPHMLTVAAMLSIDNLFLAERPPPARSDADNARIALKQEMLVRAAPCSHACMPRASRSREDAGARRPL